MKNLILKEVKNAIQEAENEPDLSQQDFIQSIIEQYEQEGVIGDFQNMNSPIITKTFINKEDIN
jgi:ribosomal protein S8